MAKCKDCEQTVPISDIKLSISPRGPVCATCGRNIRVSSSTNLQQEMFKKSQWDNYFHGLCIAVASKSNCLSRQIGAVIVKDHSIVSTGYNGPPRGYPHCDGGKCPRQLKGYKSGEGLHECTAAHAEANAIVNAARNGVSTLGCTLYLNTMVPCKDCMILIINAGIIEIVCEELKLYHEMSARLLAYTDIKVRTFS